MCMALNTYTVCISVNKIGCANVHQRVIDALSPMSIRMCMALCQGRVSSSQLFTSAKRFEFGAQHAKTFPVTSECTARSWFFMFPGFSKH